MNVYLNFFQLYLFNFFKDEQHYYNSNPNYFQYDQIVLSAIYHKEIE